MRVTLKRRLKSKNIPMVKRFFDILLSSIALARLAPMFLVIIVILRLTGEGEVFYLQERVGYRNQPFKIIKFATMLANSEKMGTGSLTLRNDPRVLPVGKFLRKTKINELPQFINVFIGNMSLVGPRPQMARDLAKFQPDAQERMYYSKPGITGLGSIVFRDEERWISEYEGDKHEFYREKIAPYKGELELWYGKHKDVFMDLKLLFITAYVILYPMSDILYNSINDLPRRPSHLK